MDKRVEEEIETEIELSKTYVIYREMSWVTTKQDQLFKPTPMRIDSRKPTKASQLESK